MTAPARMSAAEWKVASVREDTLHASIVQLLRVTRPDLIVFHPPNGGRRDKREAAKLKWLGVLPGVPDIVIVAPGGRTHFIEVKGPKGVLSEDQQAFRHHCERYEIPWAVVKTIDAARDVLSGWKLLESQQ